MTFAVGQVGTQLRRARLGVGGPGVGKVRMKAGTNRGTFVPCGAVAVGMATVTGLTVGTSLGMQAVGQWAPIDVGLEVTGVMAGTAP